MDFKYCMELIKENDLYCNQQRKFYEIVEINNDEKIAKVKFLRTGNEVVTKLESAYCGTVEDKTLFEDGGCQNDAIVKITPSGKAIKIYKDIITASYEEKLSVLNIMNAIENKITCGGYLWKDINEFETLVICVMGHTASGKDTIVKRISSEMGIPILVSHTTRPPRSQAEIDEKAYYFVDDSFFEEEDSLRFVEKREYKTKFGKWKYGLTIGELSKCRVSLFIVDNQGREELSELIGENNILSLFIEVDEDTLRERVAKRGDSLEEFERRLEDDKKRFDEAIVDFTIDNYDLDLAISKIKKIISIELGDKIINEQRNK